MSDFDEFRIHAIAVETMTGEGGAGPIYAPAAAFSPITGTGVLVDDKRRLVRATDGAQVISESTVFDPDVTHASSYVPGSRVVLPSGRTATVITVAVRQDPTGMLPEHVEVACT